MPTYLPILAHGTNLTKIIKQSTAIKRARYQPCSRPCSHRITRTNTRARIAHTYFIIHSAPGIILYKILYPYRVGNRIFPSFRRSADAGKSGKTPQKATLCMAAPGVLLLRV